MTPNEGIVGNVEFSESNRDVMVREILATTLNLARDLQRELGRLQQIVDQNVPPLPGAGHE